MEEATPYLDKWKKKNSRNVVDIRERLDKGDMVRAGGDCICEICGKRYLDHPVVEEFEWLNVLCNDKLVKL